MEKLLLGDWFMILVYSVLMVVIGFYCSRYALKSMSYFAGGRQIPWWLSGISAWMGAFSAYVFVGLASAVYRVGLATLFHILYAMAFAWFVGALVWAARWRRTGIVTVPEYMEKRFNLTTRQVFAWIVTPFRIADDGVKCYATAKIMAFVFGIPALYSIIGLSVVTIAYTMIGGLWAVMITDMVQFVILVTVVFVVVPIGLEKIGWLGGLRAGAPEGFFDIFHVPADFGGEFTILYFAAMWVMHPFLYNGSFTLVQRYTTVPTPRDAKRSAGFSMGLSLVFFPLLIAPPMISRVLYGDTLMASTALQETSYIKLCVDLLPVGMIGIVAVAIMAATMSALSADFNIYGAVLTNDLYHRLINRRASQTRLARVGKFNTMLVGGLALLMALGVPRMGGAFKVMMNILGLIGGPTTIPILFGLWIKRPGPDAAIAAIVSGIGFGALGLWVWELPYAWFVLGNIAVTLVVFLAWGMLRPAGGEVRERIEEFFRRISTGEGVVRSDEEIEAEKQELEAAGPEGPGPEKEKAPSPFAIVGVIIAIIGLALGGVGLVSGSGTGILIDSTVALFMLLLGWLMVRHGRRAVRKSLEKAGGRGRDEL